MIPLTPKVIASKEAFLEHFKKALSLYEKEEWEDALERFRKAAEAFMKIYIFLHFGDELGQDILDGKKDFQNNPLPSPHNILMLNDMFDLQAQVRFWSISQYSNYYSRVKDLQRKGNSFSHDNNDKEPLIRFATLCKSQVIELAHGLYSDLGENLPQVFKIESEHNDFECTLSDWKDFYDFTEEFENRCRYILVAPKEYNNCSIEALGILRKIKWSTIVDFNPRTKVEGLYKSFGKEVDEKCIPLMITQFRERNIASNSSGNTINWIFANGLNTVPETVTIDFRSWRSKKYHKLISNVIEDSNRNSISRLCIVIVNIEIDYLAEIVRELADIDGIENDLIRIAYCSSNIELRKEVEAQLQNFDFNSHVFNLSISELVSGIASVTKHEESGNIIFIPGKTKDKEDELLDATDKYSRLFDLGIHIVHQNIADTCEETALPIPNFFSGCRITWRELAEEVDVSRDLFEELKLKITGLLDNSKQSVKFDLFHQPGAGGTTISLRLAYSLRGKYPTIILTSYDKTKSYDKLSELISIVNMPVLAISEASDIRENDVRDLILRCNKRKQVVVFLVIKRELKRQKKSSGSLSMSLTDKIRGNDEKARFISKLKLYTNKSETIRALEDLPVTSSEVIDYALALSQGTYSKSKLSDYVKEYLNQLPDDQIRFVSFVCLIYHYSQLRVSQLLFRKMFKQNLDEFLRTNGEKYILKILVQESENGEATEYWRPRFSIFAEIALHILLGDGTDNETWKDKLPLYAKDLITVIKENNPSLVDESKRLLTNVFLERGNEDFLGVESDWNSIVFNEQFSMLLKDIGEKADEQKNILLLLANSFPRESHFWAHLGRFVYEKAESSLEYKEAIDYIERAFSEGGNIDYNIQHIAGMCFRREIEYYKRNNQELPFDELEELTEKSKCYFEKSREIQPTNIYAYISEVQLLSCVLEYGMFLSKHNDFRQFLLDADYSWFLEQYEIMNELIDDANIVLQQQEQLGESMRVMRSRSMLRLKESQSKSYMGDYQTSLPMISKLIEKSPREQRPRLRTTYVRSLLLSKVQGDKTKLTEAWAKLSDNECRIVNDYLTTNVKQDSSNIYSLRLWFDFVRYSKYEINDNEIISRLTMMYENSQERSLNRGQAAYYLMILKSIQLIKQGFSIIERPFDEIKKFREECQRISSYDKYSYEWLQDLSGIKGIVNYRQKGEKTVLMDFSGTITDVFSPQQGTIRLDCGLDAFFWPIHGNFSRDKDVSEKVLFKIGFRHDGLAAYDVHRENEIVTINNTQEEIPAEIETLQQNDEDKEKVEIYKTDSEHALAKGPVILGKIDLNSLTRGKNGSK
jgi:hypothetical protein